MILIYQLHDLWSITGRYNYSGPLEDASIFQTLFSANIGHIGQDKVLL